MASVKLRSIRSQIAFSVLLVLLASSLSVGGLTPEGLGCSILSLFFVLNEERRQMTWDESPEATVVIWGLVGMAGLDLLQLVPLPHALLRWLSPGTASVWEGARGPLAAGAPSWHAMSLEPYGTAVDFFRVTTYLAFFLAMRSLLRSKHGLVRAESAILITGSVMAVAALAHPALGAERLFGVYTPETPRGMHLAPLLNPNHLAAYLTPPTLLALRQTQASKPMLPKSAAWGLLSLLMVAVAYAGSRGGTLALALGAAGLLYTRARIVKKGGTTRSLRMALATCGFVALVGIVAFVLPQVRTELLDSDMSKTDIWKAAAELSLRIKAFGVGRGAFGSAISATAGIVNNESPTHPENVVLQLLCEYGWLAAVGLIAAGLWIVRPASFARIDASRRWAYWAVIALLAHDVADFALEVPGVALLGIVVLAIALPAGGPYPPAPPATRKERAIRRLPRALVPLVAGLALFVARRAPEVELRDAREELTHAPLKDERLLELASRHPASAYVALLGAVSETRQGSERAIAWAARALTLSTRHGQPYYGRAHAALATHLRSRNPSQALLEYRAAIVEDSSLVPVVGPEMVAMVRSSSDLEDILPPEPALRAQLLSQWAPRLAIRIPSSVDRELRALPEAQRQTAVFFRKKAEDALRDAAFGSPWCGERGQLCARDALAAMRSLAPLSSDSCEVPAMLTEITEKMEVFPRAAMAHESVIQLSTDKFHCASKLLGSYARRGDRTSFDTLSTLVRKWPCSAGNSCVQSLLAIADQDVAFGRREKALVEIHRIQREVSDDDAILLAGAELSAQLGLHADAAANYRRLTTRKPGNASYAKRFAEEEKAAKDMHPTQPLH